MHIKIRGRCLCDLYVLRSEEELDRHWTKLFLTAGVAEHRGKVPWRGIREWPARPLSPSIHSVVNEFSEGNKQPLPHCFVPVSEMLSFILEQDSLNGLLPFFGPFLWKLNS